MAKNQTLFGGPKITRDTYVLASLLKVKPDLSTSRFRFEAATCTLVDRSVGRNTYAFASLLEDTSVRRPKLGDESSPTLGDENREDGFAFLRVHPSVDLRSWEIKRTTSRL